MKKTIVVNLFAGPGAGKSTAAAGAFSLLKQAGRNVEYVSEYAKDLTWGEHQFALGDQVHVLGEQHFRLFRLFGKVEAIITDSPILLGLLYAGPETPQAYRDLVLELHKGMSTLNFFLLREKAYNPSGRNQTLEQARVLDIAANEMLLRAGVEFTSIPGDWGAARRIHDAVVERIYQNV
jgi:hypothetical protein